MYNRNSIDNIEEIERNFREVQEHFSEFDSDSQLADRLNSYDITFRSIAYEAASMCLALVDIKAQSGLLRWEKFLESYGKLHVTQYYIGLGWALAQENINPLSFALEWSERVLDGYGYYEGMFRRRKAIHQKQLPEWCKDSQPQIVYDTGLGRSIWYASNGDVTSVKKIMQDFSTDRQPALWRGLGVAIAYAGGSSEDELAELANASGELCSELAKGSEMAIASRTTANSPTEDMYRVRRIFEKYA